MQCVISRPAQLRRVESSLVLSRMLLATVAVLAAIAAAVLSINQGIAVLVVTGTGMFLLGYVADRAAQARAQSELLRRVITRAYAQPGIRGLLHAAFEELSGVLHSDVIVIAARDRRRGQMFAWQLRRKSAGSEIHVLPMDGIPEDELFFVPAGQTWAFAVENGAAVRRQRVCDDGAPDAPAVAPGAAVLDMSPRGFVAATVHLWDRWEGTAILLDPRATPSMSQLRLVQAIARELRGPALNAFDLSRLRGRIITAQRTRLARDLHDGILQSLIGLELKTHALRERVAQKDPDVAAGLGQLQRALRKETAEARRLMQDLRAGVVQPHELVEAMAAATLKFQHDTGITATFEAGDQQSAVSGRVSAELTRILQEALSNVRRHSRARTVAVRLSHGDGICRLTIEDDGAGFPFSGRRSLEELAASRTGPATIMERVRLLGGQLFIDSYPTRGARVEIAVPSGGRS